MDTSSSRWLTRPEGGGASALAGAYRWRNEQQHPEHSVADPDYGRQALAFLRANVPDQWEGMPVNFLQSYLSTVRYEDAFPEGGGEPALSR